MRNSGTVRLVALAGLHPVRLALCIGGVVFQDNTLSPNDAGQQSELQVNRETLTQFDAMLRCAGRLGGSYPVGSPIVALQVDEILHFVSEVQVKMNYPEELETAAAISRNASLIETRLQRLRKVPALEIYSEKVLLHEIAVYCWVKSIRAMGLDAEVDERRCIVKAELKVENHPNVKQLKTHQDCKTYPKLKLTYFPFPGRAEPIRLALFTAGIPFEDERIGIDELNRRRLSLPFNQLPVLEVDGEVVSQALGILRYVGTLGRLYSSSDTKEACRIDEVFSLIDEFYSSYAWNASYYEQDPAKQMQLRTVLAEETVPTTLNFLEQRTFQWNGRHSVGDRLTVADFAIYSLLWTLQSGRILGVPESIVAPHKKLLTIYETVAGHSKVREWSSMPHEAH
ncbi:hypothetical protein PHYPSEUDO_009530 [Phytophthora pseudosyringae]|uniref:Glutathione S-transferase n=1 Tax=Phytophthora pseudosyringae TaxID=221518 RepID=A0A8T1VCR6_9STRA|nr:hypothetical protein PHYPSEUDO_009530 [Phytophthora pseudosyringae]